MEWFGVIQLKQPLSNLWMFFRYQVGAFRRAPLNDSLPKSSKWFKIWRDLAGFMTYEYIWFIAAGSILIPRIWRFGYVFWNGWRTTTAIILWCIYIYICNYMCIHTCSQELLKKVPESLNVLTSHLVDLDFFVCGDVCFDPFYRIHHVHHWRLNFPTCDSSRRIPELLVESTESQTNSQAEIRNKSKPIPSKYDIFIPTYAWCICFTVFNI